MLELAQQIGVRRFELRTSPTRTERATRLRHTPSAERVAIIARWLTGTTSSTTRTSCSRCTASPSTGGRGCRSSARTRSTKVACGVSASLELFERAAAAGAQLLIVHHGMFWRNEPLVDRPAAARPARGALRRGPDAPRLSPRARRASDDRQQRAPRRRARRRGRAALRRGRPGWPATRAGRRRRARRPHPGDRGRARAARLRARAGAGRAGRDLLGRRGERADPGGARGLRPLPHRRARGAEPADRPRARDPLRRRRPRRDRAARRAGARHATSPRASRSSGSSSRSRTPSRWRSCRTRPLSPLSDERPGRLPTALGMVTGPLVDPVSPTWLRSRPVGDPGADQRRAIGSPPRYTTPSRVDESVSSSSTGEVDDTNSATRHGSSTGPLGRIRARPGIEHGARNVGSARGLPRLLRHDRVRHRVPGAERGARYRERPAAAARSCIRRSRCGLELHDPRVRSTELSSASASSTAGGRSHDHEVAAVGDDPQPRAQPAGVLERVVDRQLRVARAPDDDGRARDPVRDRGEGRRRSWRGPRSSCPCARVAPAGGRVSRSASATARPRRTTAGRPRGGTSRARRSDGGAGRRSDPAGSSWYVSAIAWTIRVLVLIPAGDTSRSPRTSSGRLCASRSATSPPNEWPATTAGPDSSASSTAAATAAKSAVEAPRGRGPEPP